MMISKRSLTAGEKEGKLSCVSISLPEELKSKIKNWAKENIKDEDLFYIDSERGREPHIHCTVRYDMYTKDADEVTEFLKEQAPVSMRLGPISKFRENDEFDNLKIEAYGPDLQDFCHEIGQRFESKDTGRKYLPHVTLAYVRKGSCDHLVGNEHFEGIKFQGDHYVFLNDKAEPHHVKVASRIDYIKEDLPEEFWDKKGSTYVLKPDVEKFLKDRILKAIGSKLKDVDSWFKNILIGSSIATQFSKIDSDIDLKIVIDEKEFKDKNPKFKSMKGDTLIESILEVFDEFKGKPMFQYKTHPFEIYPVMESEIENDDLIAHFDSLYDVNNKKWIKEPKLIDPDKYHRDEVVQEGEEMAMQWAHSWDLDLGRMRRKVKEFELIIEHLKTLDPQRRNKFKDKIENLKSGLMADIDKIYEEKEEIKHEYNESYESYDDDLEKYYGSVNALPEVIRIKMLNMWGYIKILKKLHEIVEDKNNIEISDIQKIDKALKSNKSISFRKLSNFI